MSNQAQRIETRVFRSAETRVRVTDEASRTIRGYGIVFNSDSAVLYERGKRFVEVIRPSAVEGVDFSTLKSMHNHSAMRLLGRIESGTMRTGVDNIGSWYEVDAPNSPTGEDVLESVRRGDTDGSSFQFTIAPGGETWSVKNGIAYREITKFESIFEMGPVSDPAYPGTADVGLSARSIELMLMVSICEDEKPEEDTPENEIPESDSMKMNEVKRALIEDQEIEAMQMAIL